MTDNIRNFSVIAHIDHGKSTLADRMLEVTDTVADRDMHEQVLDQMDLEQERGITIKMTPVTLKHQVGGNEYTLNLIDTPGHVDFSYEVSRALTAVEGAILLVDSTQGIEAQTLSVLTIARKLDLTLIPAVTKIDAKTADPDTVAHDVADLLDTNPSDVSRVSGKTGEGVTDLLNRITAGIPAPAEYTKRPARGLLFDFDYTAHRGVVAYTRVMDGTITADQNLSLHAADKKFRSAEVGIFSPDPTAVSTLSAGSVGYVVTGIKEPGVVTIGDTLASADADTEPLSGYEPPQPVVWASVYPENQDQFDQLANALERLLLSDSSLQFERSKSTGLGQGFRCGFLGRLHMEVTIERLRRDYDLDLITTQPSVAFEVATDEGEGMIVRTPTRFPHYGDIKTVKEPEVTITIRTPGEYINKIMTLVYDHEGEVTSTTSGDSGQLTVKASMPLRELMRGFFSELKQASSGFASLSYEVTGYAPADVVKLDVLVAKEEVPALAEIVSKANMQKRARAVVENLKELLPQQIVSVRIQARAEGDVIAAETLAATRKDVTEGLYGGDYSRKKKQLKNQREGKKQMKEDMSVQIPSDVYIDMLQK
jgi:GTP-binding protein LepA